LRENDFSVVLEMPHRELEEQQKIPDVCPASGCWKNAISNISWLEQGQGKEIIKDETEN
jgi:hypothetical protein